MNHRDITPAFLIKNVNTPENILEAFEESAYGTNDATNLLYIKCEKIAESKETVDMKKSKLTQTIIDYHTSLYKK